jgi:glutamate formiminotransferase
VRLLARQAGAEIWRRHSIPVYFYEAAAARPDRANLEDVRRGQFEQLREAAQREPKRRPDIGGPGLHPTAGACAVGARKFLVAYNIYFDSTDVSLVRAIAKELRASSGRPEGSQSDGGAGARPRTAIDEHHRSSGHSGLRGLRAAYADSQTGTRPSRRKPK